MKQVLQYFKNYKWKAILAPLFKMLEAAFELLVPLVMAAIIDNGIAGNDKPYIYKMAFVMVGLGVIGLGCSITAQYFSAKTAMGIGKEIRYDLFKHIETLSYTEIDNLGSATLITRMTSDVNQVQTGINMFLRLVMRSPFIVFGATIMAFTVNAKASRVFFITLPVLIVIVFGIMLVSIPLYKKVQSKLDTVTLKSRENLSGVRVIRAFNQEKKEKEEFAEVAKQERDTLFVWVDRIVLLLKQVAKVLAYNTNYATMVTAPNYEKTVKFIQLSLVDEKTLLAVIVIEGNIIKNQMIHINVSLDNEDVLKFNILLNTFLQGASLEDINLEMIQAMKKQSGGYGEILDQIFQGIVEAIHEAQELEVYTSGATNILKYPELGDISKTSELLEKLEDKNEVSHLLEETTGKTNESGIQVYIGDETPSLKDCSLVTATYQMPEGAKGTIGILGPKRMDYKKVVSTLKNLTIELDEIFKKGEVVKENGQ